MRRNRYTFERGRDGHLLINYGIIRAAMNRDACRGAVQWAMVGNIANNSRGELPWWTLKECWEYNRTYLLWLTENVTDLPDAYVEEIYMLTGYAVIRIAGNRRINFMEEGRQIMPACRFVTWRDNHVRKVADLKWRPAKKKVKA